MEQKIAVVMTDNGAIYWGQPVKGYDGCITLQNLVLKRDELFPTQEGRLSIPMFRVIEIIELDNSFKSPTALFEYITKKYGGKKPNMEADPSIAQQWNLEEQKAPNKGAS